MLHADVVVAALCTEAAAGRWHRGKLGVDRDVELAITALPSSSSSPERPCGVALLVRDAHPTPSEIADFRLIRSQSPFFLYEVGREPTSSLASSRTTSADVIVGFANAGQTRLDVRVSVIGPDGGPSRSISNFCVLPEDGLVPALGGRTVLPVVAMPTCHMVDVVAAPCDTIRAGGASASDAASAVDVRVVCAQLRPDVRRAVAARRYTSLPLPRIYEGDDATEDAVAAAAEAAAAATSVLPDLDAAIEAAWRIPAARARAKARHDAVFCELMARVWSPGRVRSGLVDPDS